MDDYLEIKGGFDAKKRKPLKEFLGSQTSDNLEPLAVEGFLLARNLVLFEPRESVQVEKLVFLRPRDGKICVKQVSSPTAI